MYKGNHVTTVFPLPPGADGHEVWLAGEGFGVRLAEGAASEVADGRVVFAEAPPAGTEGAE
jgi:hypothetical protein